MDKSVSFVPCLVVLAIVIWATPAWALTVEEVAKLRPADGDRSDGFGLDVALDGDTAVIGAREDEGSGSSGGSAYVFVRTEGVWSQQAKLLPSDGELWEQFGRSIALDGDTVLIGARYDDVHYRNSGSAYVFGRTEGVWTEQQKIIPTYADSGSHFGTKVALDGDIALIRQYSFDTRRYSVHTYGRAEGWWSRRDILVGAPQDNFGAGIGLFGDTAIIGVPHWFRDRGRALVYVRTGDFWTYQTALTAADGEDLDRFGTGLAFDGDTVVLGAPNDGDNGENSGSAYVFVRTEGGWTQQAKLLPSDGEWHEYFGSYVALDGDTVLIGQPYDDDKGHNSGAAYVFVRSGGIWTEEAKLLASDGSNLDVFGNGIALDGDTAIIGAPSDDDNGEASGSAYVFRLIPPDADGDGIDDEVDFCLDTIIPEAVPTNHLGVNRWALVDDDGMFDTTLPPGGGGGPEFDFSLQDTAGCSCEQIIERMALGWGHTKFGCSTGVMLQWIADAGSRHLAQPLIGPKQTAIHTLMQDAGNPSASTSGTLAVPPPRRQRSSNRDRAPRREGGRE